MKFIVSLFFTIAGLASLFVGISPIFALGTNPLIKLPSLLLLSPVDHAQYICIGFLFIGVSTTYRHLRIDKS